MPIKKALFNIKGMTRDLAASKFSPEYAYENRNLRLITTDTDNTTGVMVNERGPKVVSNVFQHGSSEKPIYQGVYGDAFIVISQWTSGATKRNSIYKIYHPNTPGSDQDSLLTSELFKGTLNLEAYAPPEGIFVYENERIQKLYLTDGRTQPRIINLSSLEISNRDATNTTNYYSDFDFIRTITGNTNVTIEKNLNSNGIFPSGTIQYVFSYYVLNGQQSNIFYTSPIYYIAYNDRGAAENDTVSCSFIISLSNLDTSFDYIRIYSIQRTSANATPYVRKVTDLKINGSSTSYTDNGEAGESVDPTSLFFVGGQSITAGTMAQKDNTLFLGDIKLNKIPITAAMETAAANATFYNDEYKTINVESISGYYTYENQLSKSNSVITTYKNGDKYRFGVQLQDKYGIWSEPILIRDEIINYTPKFLDNQLRLACPSANLSSLVSLATSNGNFIKMRPVVVFPTLSQRKVLCQGVVNPTVFNTEDRYNHFPDFQASWFFRPTFPTLTSGGSANNTLDSGAAEFRHNFPIPSNDQKNAEIQCIVSPPFLAGYSDGGENLENFVNNNNECYYVNHSVFTLNSPDIEFDNTLQSITFDNYKFRIVGYIPIQANICDVDIQTSSSPLNYSSGADTSYAEKPIGFYKRVDSQDYSANNPKGYCGLRAKPYWMDEIYGSTVNNSNKNPAGFIIYPWQRSGSLNNTRGLDSSKNPPSVLSQKKMSILRFSDCPKFDYDSSWSPTNAVRDIQLFNSTEDTILKLPNSNLTYKGNVDKVVTFHTKRNESTNKTTPANSLWDVQYADWDFDGGIQAAYPIITAKADNTIYYASSPVSDTAENSNFRNSPSAILNSWENYGTSAFGFGKAVGYDYQPQYATHSSNVKAFSRDPVSIKYKSTPHLVISLNANTILPQVKNDSDVFRQLSLFGDTDTFVIKRPSTKNGFLWLGEIYTDVNPNFGNVEDNTWVIAGPEVNISSSNNTTLYWKEGDTYFQRYDCLKTYPFTMEDPNSVVDILSFMCETRINIDGRYDKNRGLSNNLYMSPTNFNLINKNYTQIDNFFTYKINNSPTANFNNFPNTITWTKTKTLGEKIDSWTNITLASTLDLDGNLGNITALRKFNDQLLAFQDKGISQILYNENVQISSATGVPIEIANSGKVSGKRYISNQIGCSNKWSICESPSRLYFVDGLGKIIYAYNGQLEDLSNTRGFRSWMLNQLYLDIPWNPVNWNESGGRTHYDFTNHEIMFVTKNESLSFSEITNQFTSFYDYGKCSFFNTTNNRSLMWLENNSASVSPYLYQRGYYSYFANGFRPFYTTVVVNPNPTEDKIFNNLEFRADSFNVDNYNYYVCEHTFDRLDVWNEYQKGYVNLIDTPNKPSPIKKKFRVWRVNIPRWNVAVNGVAANNRDRMRNPWLYLKLSMNNAPNDELKVVLHDLVVDYFE